jgi:hypothetical protein
MMVLKDLPTTGLAAAQLKASFEGGSPYLNYGAVIKLVITKFVHSLFKSAR